jgi:hypothetical protein
METVDTSVNTPETDAAVADGWDSVDDNGATKQPVAPAAGKDEGAEAGGDDSGADGAAVKDGDEEGAAGDDAEKKEPTAEEALAALEAKGNELLAAADGETADDGKPPVVDTQKFVDDLFIEDAKEKAEDGTEYSLTETMSGLPDIKFTMKTVLNRYTEKLIKLGIITVKAEAQAPDKTAATAAEVAELRARQINAEFWRDVMDERPDARKIANSPEFKAWVAKSSKAVQHLASTPDAQSALMVIDAYERATGKKAPAAAAAKPKPAVADLRTLRRSATGSRGPAPVARSKKDPNDFDAGWDEAE